MEQLPALDDAGLKHSKEPRAPGIREFNDRWSGTFSLQTNCDPESGRSRFNALRTLPQEPFLTSTCLQRVNLCGSTKVGAYRT